MKPLLLTLLLIAAAATADAMRSPAPAAPQAIVDCGSLSGVGAVVLAIDNKRYVVVVECGKAI